MCKEVAMSRLPLATLTAGLIGMAAFTAFAAPSAADRDFMQKAASGGMAEVQTAELAQQRASSPQVKQFASRMITDHTQANSELQQLAEKQNVTLPAKPLTKDAVAGQKLQGLNGVAFDQAYTQQALRDHQEAVALFRKEATSGQDPELKAFAQKTLPVLQQHLQMAQVLSRSH
jgi:putative membrane protein